MVYLVALLVGACVMMVTVAVYALALVLVFTSARYRAPLWPLAAVVAVGGTVALVEGIRARHWRPVAVACGVALATLLAGTAVADDRDFLRKLAAPPNLIFILDTSGLLAPVYPNKHSRLDLVVSGHDDAIAMVEASAKELPEAEVIDALEMAGIDPLYTLCFPRLIGITSA